MDEEKKKIIKIDLEGLRGDLFTKLRSKLIDAVDKFLDSPFDYETSSTIRDEVKNFTSLGLNYAKSKLKKPSIENHKLISEIELNYTEIEKKKAVARKENAIAETIEFNHSLRKLVISLKMSKALIIGDKNKEAIIFTQQIDAFLNAIEGIAQEKKLIE